jgi:hypothetical protein
VRRCPGRWPGWARLRFDGRLVRRFVRKWHLRSRLAKASCSHFRPSSPAVNPVCVRVAGAARASWSSGRRRLPPPAAAPARRWTPGRRRRSPASAAGCPTAPAGRPAATRAMAARSGSVAPSIAQDCPPPRWMTLRNPPSLPSPAATSAAAGPRPRRSAGSEPGRQRRAPGGSRPADRSRRRIAARLPRARRAGWHGPAGPVGRADATARQPPGQPDSDPAHSDPAEDPVHSDPAEGPADSDPARPARRS